jgi:hypothetical protein
MTVSCGVGGIRAGICDDVACGVSGIRAGICDDVACSVLAVLAPWVTAVLVVWVILGGVS